MRPPARMARWVSPANISAWVFFAHDRNPPVAGGARSPEIPAQWPGRASYRARPVLWDCGECAWFFPCRCGSSRRACHPALQTTPELRQANPICEKSLGKCISDRELRLGSNSLFPGTVEIVNPNVPASFLLILGRRDDVPKVLASFSGPVSGSFGSPRELRRTHRSRPGDADSPLWSRPTQFCQRRVPFGPPEMNWNPMHHVGRKLQVRLPSVNWPFFRPPSGGR